MALIETKIEIVRDDDLTIQYRVESDGAPIDITDYSFKFAVKTHLKASTPTIEVDGTIDDGLGGEFSFDLLSAVTGLDPFCGLYEIAMITDTGEKTTLTVPGGAPWELVEKITTVV